MKNKKNKYAYVVDITECNDVNDVAVNFALAKHNAGISLTDSNLLAIVDYSLSVFAEAFPAITVIACDCTCNVTKTPWYKRLWNRIKYSFAK